VETRGSPGGWLELPVESLVSGSTAPPRTTEPRPGLAGAAPALSVVLPVHDEECAIGLTLDALHEALAGCGRAYEIVVVDDGSHDDTPRLLGARTDVRVVRHERRRGYGASLMTGIRAARHELVVVMDVDGTYPAGAVPRLAEACADHAMVVGARTGPGIRETRLRRTVKGLFRRYAEWLTGARIPDLNSGMRVFRRALPLHFADVLPEGFSFTTTITVSSLAQGFSVAFEEIEYGARIGQSKLRPLPDTLRIGRQLLRLGARFAPLRTALSVALPIALLGAALSARDLATDGDLGAIALSSFAVMLAVVVAGALAQHRLPARHADLARPAASPGA